VKRIRLHPNGTVKNIRETVDLTSDNSPHGAPLSAPRLVSLLADARRRTLELIEGLGDEQLMGPRLPIVNPLLWEIGHVAWFQEIWTLRNLGKQPPLLERADALYDSSAIPQPTRWDLPLPPLPATLRYMAQILERVCERLERVGRNGLEPDESYFHQLVLFHEDMHDEAFLYTRQTLCYPAPRLTARAPAAPAGGGPLPGDAEVPGGPLLLGAEPDAPFVFDNEKWAHPVEVRPFRIARAAVTQAEFLAFVEEGGYRRPELWSAEGWQWRERERAEHPVYWRRDGDGRWSRRVFDTMVPLEPHLPVLHVCWHEAEAWCRWAGRRLPAEAEWELAASGVPEGAGLAAHKRRFPWGETPPEARHANLDAAVLGCLDVGALPDGDSAFGCRQMIGNVWEWTASDFLPYPGFVADPYKDYSEPWFGSHKVLRGGAWMTRGRLLRNTWRNFYKPDRRDVWAGFRTCALEV
jgi:ergothioneine biosynthesis protein EgtB